MRVLNVPRLFIINSFQFLPQLPFTCRECLLNLLVCLLLCVTLSRTLVHNDNAAVCLVFLRFHCLVQTGCLGRLQAGHRHALMSYLSPTSLIPSWLTCPARTNLCIYLSTFSSFMVQRENILLKLHLLVATFVSCSDKAVNKGPTDNVTTCCCYLADMVAPSLVCYPLLVLETDSRSCPRSPLGVSSALLLTRLLATCA